MMILIVGILAGGGVVSWIVASLKEPPKRTEPAERVTTVQVYEAEVVTVQELVSGFGTARAMQEVDLSAQVSGEIVETLTPLKVGRSIQAASVTLGADGTSQRTGGDLIVRIDPKTYQEQLEQAEDLLNEDQAELDRLQQEKKNLERKLAIAKKNFASYQAEFDRIQGLVNQKVANASDLTTAELDLRRYEDAMVLIETELDLIPSRIRQIEAKRQTRRNDLAMKKLELDRTEVISPISGQLSEIFVERGQYVRVGDPIVTVTNVDLVEVPVGISLEDYSKIVAQIDSQKYPSAILSTRLSGGTQWKGTVTRVAPTADPETRTVEVFVVVDNSTSDAPLLPGTFVTIQIEGPIHEDVVPIPRDLIIDDHILISKEGRVEEAEFESSGNIQTFRLVKSGLSDGDRLIMTNLDILSKGDAIRSNEQEPVTFRSELSEVSFPQLRVISSQK